MGENTVVNQYETRETNRIWNASGTDLQPTASYRNGRNETISDLETPDSAQRRYVGGTFGIKKREGRLKIFTYYTLSAIQGNIGSSLDGSYGQIALRLGISVHTVGTHIKNCYRKLGVRRAAHAVTRAAELELMPERLSSVTP